MASERIIRVEGLGSLQRAFSVADKGLSRKLRESLKDAAEPVRADAESSAVSSIRNIGIPWSRMRVGITRSSVYVAPQQRGRRSRSIIRGRRPNLKPLLLDRAMEPALEANIGGIEREAERVLDDVARRWET